MTVPLDMNLSGFRKRIAGMEAATKEAAVSMVGELSEMGVAQAKAMAPVDSGELRESIHASEIREDGGEIIGGYETNSDHAAYLEYGTGHPGESGAVANGQPKDPDNSISYTQKDYWRYKDEKGNWHTSHGQPAQPYMYPSAVAVSEELPQTLEKYGKEIVKGGGAGA